VRLLLLVLLLLPGCPDGDMGDFQGFLEVADAWGFSPENARGVCLFDADGDADLDVLFTQRESLRFYLNFAPEFFVEATAGAGLDGDVGESPAGCGAADLDGDGDRDLIVTFNRDDTRVFTNDGAAHFADATVALGFNGWGQSSVVFEDVDRDGRIDVLLSGARDGRTQLLQNAGTFLDITPSLSSGDVFDTFTDLVTHDGRALDQLSACYRVSSEGGREWGLCGSPVGDGILACEL
jgi:hypothetical protein